MFFLDAEQSDGEPPKKTPSKKSKGKKSKKNAPKKEEEEEPKPQEEEPALSPITHEPEVLVDSAMPPPLPTPSVGQLEKKPRVRDFWVCWGLLALFALACGIGFAVLHTTTFADGQPKSRLMKAVREMGAHGAILSGRPSGGEHSSGQSPAESTTTSAPPPSTT